MFLMQHGTRSRHLAVFVDAVGIVVGRRLGCRGVAGHETGATSAMGCHRPIHRHAGHRRHIVLHRLTAGCRLHVHAGHVVFHRTARPIGHGHARHAGHVVAGMRVSRWRRLVTGHLHAGHSPHARHVVRRRLGFCCRCPALRGGRLALSRGRSGAPGLACWLGHRLFLRRWLSSRHVHARHILHRLRADWGRQGERGRADQKEKRLHAASPRGRTETTRIIPACM